MYMLGNNPIKRSPHKGFPPFLCILLFTTTLFVRGRPLDIYARHNKGQKRVKVSITLSKKTVERLDKMVDERIYVNRSHAIESLIKPELDKPVGYFRK